ncbi:type II toxin-antitoxin system VapC family toxin [Hymenobacter sp. RP-2-7]|uniref:Type II toxin-antitoxin system VapC family toxin n=1 Tax=Hymenobacter polaris TaxID=2682546 RepID=A0A7Y0AFV2_9BACT|nr:type II toxin-antitoxin system VapC family toxin [Hymenobacter polaris]NML66422.1 type II toxin-antitoxin system VapC family toxin [Hymenobacter polaris]
MADYLLDTHTLLWYAGADPRLPAAISQLIADPASRVVVSRASLWEITIKESLGKLILSQPHAQWMQMLRTYDFYILEITDAHLLTLSQLSQVKDHRDPFDRLLIAQALAERLTLVSRDGKFGAYAAIGLQLAWE